MKHIYHHLQNRQPVGICSITQGAQLGALQQPRDWDGVRGEWGVQEGGEICIHVAGSC